MENYKKWSTVCMVYVGKGFLEVALLSWVHKGKCLSVQQSPFPVCVAFVFLVFMLHILQLMVSQNYFAAVDSWYPLFSVESKKAR